MASIFLQVLRYNVPFGKKNRGLAVVETFSLLNPSAGDEEMHLARVLGWCVEIVRLNHLTHFSIFTLNSSRITLVSIFSSRQHY